MASVKKASQQDLRKLMRKGNARVDHPLAKYNGAGQLICVLCNSLVKSELQWTAHINGKSHKDNIIALRKEKEKQQLQPPEAPKKRAAPTTAADVPQPKKTKVEEEPKKGLPDNFFDEKPVPPKPKGILKNKNDSSIVVPSVAAITAEEEEAAEEPMEVVEDATGSAKLPEGFFDDPIQDAKARRVEYRDPAEEEWERFMKEIQDVTAASAQIVEEERVEATEERQIDEVDEQLRHWSRVVAMAKKKEEIKFSAETENAKMEEEEDSVSGDELVDEFVDWRVKKPWVK